MSAIQLIFELFDLNSEFLVSRDLYGGSFRYFDELEHKGAQKFIYFTDEEDLKNKITDKEEFSFLDCTIGLGSDSIVVSYAFPQAKIKGLEGSLPIWLATSYGLAHYSHNVKSVTDALRRIEVSYDIFENYVPNLPDESIDIIYFDPMFEVPVEDSPQFKPLRGHTVESRIDDKIMEEAMRVASYGVIIKERPFSSVFQKYPPHQWVGGKYSRIGYGVYMKELL